LRCKTLSLLFVPRLARGMEIFMQVASYVLVVDIKIQM